VGKGDMKTRRGKIYRGSFGKSRPKQPGKKNAATKGPGAGSGPRK
jgi:ribosomal small subunit protein bTHX